MRRKICATIICFLWVITIIVDKNPREAALFVTSEPVIGSIINMIVSWNYINARDLSFEYIGRDELDRGKAEKAEWNEILDVSLYEKQWTFIVDSEAEYQTEYAVYGMESAPGKGHTHFSQGAG